MKIQLFAIILIIKTFLLSQNGVEAGPKMCKTDADCNVLFSQKCTPSFIGNICIDGWKLTTKRP